MDHSKKAREWLLVVLLSTYGPLTVLLPIAAMFFSLQSTVESLKLLKEACGRSTGLVAYGMQSTLLCICAEIPSTTPVAMKNSRFPIWFATLSIPL